VRSIYHRRDWRESMHERYIKRCDCKVLQEDKLDFTIAQISTGMCQMLVHMMNCNNVCAAQVEYTTISVITTLLRALAVRGDDGQEVTDHAEVERRFEAILSTLVEDTRELTANWLRKLSDVEQQKGALH